MANKQIKYNIGFKVDKSSLDTVRNSLQELSKMGLTQLQLIDKKPIDEAKSNLQNLKKTVQDVQTALTHSYDMKLDTVNVKTFTKEIEKTQGGLRNLAVIMNSAGNTGKAAFTDLISTLFTTQNAVKETNKLFDSLKQSFLNTVKWSISSSILNTFTGSIQQAWGYTQRLDKSLNDIRIVTEKSNEEMEKFAKSANKAAKSLGSSTINYTDAALIYYQQGLGEKDVQARTQTTVKAANVTGQSAAEVSEQLTAVWNGYKVTAEEAELYVDKLAAVAASTAADLEEISTGMSKVASAANAMGVDVDQLSAQLSTIVSVTRQDAAVVGTALKTIYSRMADLKVNGADEFGVSLGEVSSSLKAVGIEVLDQEGNLRDMGTVIEEVAGKWETWTSAQQQAVAQSIAGKRQFNNLLALFENWDMYESSLSTSRGAEGTLQKQNEIYLDSIKAKLNELKAASEGLFDNLIDSESTKKLIDVLIWLVEAIDQLAQSLGGLGDILVLLGGVMTKVYSSDISKAMGNVAEDHIQKKFNKGQNYAKNKAAQELSSYDLNWDDDKMTEGQKEIVRLEKERLRYAGQLSEKQEQEYDTLIHRIAAMEKEKGLLEDKNKEILGEVKGMGATDARFKTPDASGLSSDNLLDAQNFVNDRIVDSRDTKMKISNVHKNTSKAKKKDAVESTQRVALTEQNKLRMAALKTNKEYAEVLSKVRKEESLDQKELDTLNKYLKEANKIIDDDIETLEKFSDTLGKNSEKTEKLAQGMEDVSQSADKLSKAGKIREISKAITDMAGAALLAWSAFNQMINIFDIFRDDTLSTSEKITQAIGAIIAIMGILTPAIITAVKLISGTTRKELEAVGAEAIKLQLSMGWISVALTAIALVLGVVMAIINKPSKPTALEQAKKAAEEAAAAAEEAKNKVNELEEAYKSLQSGLENYQSARKAIDNMKEGTEEWKQAVSDLNLQVIDLINKYPELASGFKVVDGVYTLSQDAMDAALESAKSKAFGSQMTLALANINSATKNIELRKQQTKNNIDDDSLLGKTNEELDKILVEISSQTGKYTEDFVNATKEAIKTVKNSNVIIDQQKEEIKANTEMLKAAAANKNGLNVGVNSVLTEGISTDINDYQISISELTKDGQDRDYKGGYGKNASGLNAIKQVFYDEVANTADSKDGAADAATAVTKALQSLFPDSNVVGPTISKGDDVANLGNKTVKIDGEEMTIERAMQLAAQNKMEKALTSDENQNWLRDNNYHQGAALFMKGYQGDATTWEGATYSDYQQILAEQDKTGATGVSNAMGSFASKIASVLGVDSSLIATAYSTFSEENAKSFNEARNQFNATGRTEAIDKIISAAEGKNDPEVMEELLSDMLEVDFSNTDSIADFIFKNTAEIQEKIRKKELDYFKNINKELEKLNSELERAVGARKGSLLNQIIAQEKAGLTQAESQKEEADLILSQFKLAYGTNVGKYFNADGTVNVQALNDRIAQLDNENGSEEEKAEYARLMELQNHWDYVIDSEQTLQEHINSVIDAQIESAKYLAEWQRSMNEFLKKWDEFQINFKGSLDDWDKSAALTAKEMAEIQIEYAVKDYLGIVDTLSKLGISTFTATDSDATVDQNKFFEENKEALSTAMSDLENLQGGIESLYGSYLDIQDEILAKYDKEIEKREKIKSILQSSVDLMKIAGVGGTDTLFGSMTSYSQKEFEFAQAQLTAVQTEFEKITADGAEASQEMIDKVTENLAAAGENVLAKGQEYYSAIANQFANEMAGLFDKAVKITGASNLAGVTEAWDLAVAKDSRYLDSVNEAYAMSSLERQFNASIESTDNIAAQNKLLAKQAEIQQKLAKIKDEQGKLSQADLDRANAEYELTLKQIALEESQQAANKMKLTRDAMGNYTYQYVADQDAIAKAEEELAAAENNLYNMDKDRTQSLVSEYYSAMSEANSQIAEAMAANDQERVDRLKDYYFGEGGLLSGIQKELGFASSNLSTMQNIYSTFTDSILTKDENGNTSFDLMKNSIIDMIYGTADEDGNRNGGYQSTMEALSATISGLFAKDGILQTLPEQMSKGLVAAIDIDNLTDASSSIVTNLPNILSKLQTFEAQIGGDQGFINKFNKFIEDNDAEEEKRKAEEEALRNNVKDIASRIQGKMKIWFENSSLGDFFFDQDSNESN